MEAKEDAQNTLKIKQNRYQSHRHLKVHCSLPLWEKSHQPCRLPQTYCFRTDGNFDFIVYTFTTQAFSVYIISQRLLCHYLKSLPICCMPVLYFGTIDFRFTRLYASHKKQWFHFTCQSVAFCLSKQFLASIKYSVHQTILKPGSCQTINIVFQVK